MNTILVATDGSEGADRAVDYAAQLAKESGARLLIVNAMAIHDVPQAVLDQFSRTQDAWLRDTLAAHSAEILQRARDRARTVGVKMVRLESRNGDAAQSILDIAQEAAADLIVIGKRGSGRVAGLLIGSVSQKLVSLSPKVVIVVP